jgi:ABC-2 type transport system ATP-binding protein
MNPLIEIHSLKKHYGNIQAVDRLDFTVFESDVYGFLGPNGSGKSTTIRMILSLVQPDSGDILLFGKKLQWGHTSYLSTVGALVEKPDFYTYLSAEKNLKLFARISGSNIKKNDIHKALKVTGLFERRNSLVKTFSQGMKQRLGIAQALLHKPKLLILDEPLNGLDPQGITEIRDLLKQLNKEMGMTLLISSHLLHEVELSCNRMLIINQGKAAVEGSVDELLNPNRLNVTFTVNHPQKAVELLQGVAGIENIILINRNEVCAEMDSTQIAQINKILINADIEVSAIKPLRSLEKYFMSITSES